MAQAVGVAGNAPQPRHGIRVPRLERALPARRRSLEGLRRPQMGDVQPGEEERLEAPQGVEGRRRGALEVRRDGPDRQRGQPRPRQGRQAQEGQAPVLRRVLQRLQPLVLRRGARDRAGDRERRRRDRRARRRADSLVPMPRQGGAEREGVLLPLQRRRDGAAARAVQVQRGVRRDPAARDGTCHRPRPRAGAERAVRRLGLRLRGAGRGAVEPLRVMRARRPRGARRVRRALRPPRRVPEELGGGDQGRPRRPVQGRGGSGQGGDVQRRALEREHWQQPAAAKAVALPESA